MHWKAPWKAASSRQRHRLLRAGASEAYAKVGVISFDGPINLQSLGLYGLPEAAPAVLNGTPLLTGALFGSGRREFAAEVSWDLPSLAPGATSLLDVTVNGARAGDLAQASLVSSTRFIELDAAVWSNNTVRVMARNISGATFDLAAVTLSVGVVKRRMPDGFSYHDQILAEGARHPVTHPLCLSCPACRGKYVASPMTATRVGTSRFATIPFPPQAEAGSSRRCATPP